MVFGSYFEISEKKMIFEVETLRQKSTQFHIMQILFLIFAIFQLHQVLKMSFITLHAQFCPFFYINMIFLNKS